MLPIKIAIADDHILFVKGLKMILAEFEYLSIIVEAYDGETLINEITQKRPDVVLLDLNMPKKDGQEVLQWIKQNLPKTKVLILTMRDEERLITHLLKEGANGYLLKNEAPELVAQAIREVTQKDIYINDTAANALLNQIKSPEKKTIINPSNQIEEELSSRELEVLQLICREKTTSEIAKVLFLSPRTIEGHRKRLLEKTGARNTAGLVIFAAKNNLINPGEI